MSRRTRAEIVESLLLAVPLTARGEDGFVFEALAELLDPHVERPEPILLGYSRSQWEAWDLNEWDRATVTASFKSRAFTESHIADLVEILYAHRVSLVQGDRHG